MPNKKEIEYIYNGSIYEMNLNTLLLTQFQYSAILTEITKSINPEYKLNIKIKAVEKGSFNINQIIEIAVNTTIFSAVNYDIIKKIFNIFHDIIKIKKLLKSEKAKQEIIEGENIIIKNSNNVSINISRDSYNLYKNNSIINKALRDNAKHLKEEEEIESITIKDKRTNTKYIELSQIDFDDLDSENPYLEDIDESIRDEVILYIKKIDLAPKKSTKWDFIYDGRVIKNVKILDEKFLKDVIKGLKFGNGDKLLVKLKIIKKFNPEYGTYIENKFEILEVYKVIPKEEQLKLKFDN